MLKLRIKTKLVLGLMLLFSIIVLISALSLYAINSLAGQSKNMLKANYESIVYAEKMEQALDEYSPKNIAAINLFEQNLKAQENNLTEIGEPEATANVRNLFEKLKQADSTSHISLIKQIRTGIYLISDLNMGAIVRKNSDAQHLAEKLQIYLAILATFSFLVSFTLLMNFPGYIANPINELTKGIKQIANKNYTQRIHLDKEDEFGELADAFNTMAQELDEYNNSNLAKIIFQKKRIDTIINNMKDPIIGLDEKLNVLFANDALVKIMGIDRNNLIGKYAPDVALKNDLLRTMLNSKNDTAPLKIFADKKESYFNKETIQVTSENQAIGVVIMLRNITTFKELDLAKTNFIATVSHELKTPIASIKMSLKLLNDERVGNLNEEQKQLISHIKDDGERLLNITSELLNMTQVETGNIHLKFHPAFPKGIIEYAIGAIKLQAEQRHITLEVNCATNLPNVMADAEKTVWVMINLLSNAIRYSPENGKVIIEATQSDGNVIFSVKDFGIGIEDKYKDQLFERYFQVPGGPRSGTGLGLAISKEFITAQGGEIWVESTTGKGSVFYFALPVVS